MAVGRHVTFDTETTLGTDADPVPDLVCAVFYEPGRTPEILKDVDAADRFEALVDDGSTVFVTHNGPFDYTVLAKFRPRLLKKIFAAYDHDRIRDTQTRQQLLDVKDGLASDSDAGDEDGGRIILRQKGGVWFKSGLSLADLQFYHLGVDRRAEKKDPNSPRMRFVEVRGLAVADYPPEFTKYLLEDGTGTWDVFVAQGPPCLPNEPDQARSALALKLIELRGMGVHEERVVALEERATTAFAAIQAKMTEAGFYRAGERDPANGRKWKTGSKNNGAIEAAVLAAYDRLGVAPPKTKTGRTSKDKDCLKYSGDPLLVELSGAGPLSSTVNTFLPLLKKGLANGGRLRTRYNNMLATGRISSSAPNLNNIPRDGGVRECIIPAAGFDMLNSDYDCAEMRSWAQACEYLGIKSELAEFFRRKPRGDPHAELAAFELHISPEEALRLKAEEEPEFMKVRQAQKAVNFGLPGGMGAERLRDAARRQYGAIMTLREAKKRKVMWKRRWREAGPFFDYVSDVTERSRTMNQLAPEGFGEHRVRGRNEQEPWRWFSQAANTLFQGLTADGAKRALWLVTRACYVEESSPLYGSYVVGFLYDELILESVATRTSEAADELDRLMVLGMAQWLTTVPVTTGAKAADRWSKKAKAVRDASGRLTPWRPS